MVEVPIRSLLAVLPVMQLLACGWPAGDAARPVSRTAVPDACSAVRSLQVRGVFESDGSVLRRTHPQRIVPRSPSHLHWSEDGLFRLEVRYADGHSDQIRFDAYVEDDSDPGRRTFGAFTVEIALREGDRPVAVVVADASGATVYATWDGDTLPE